MIARWIACTFLLFPVFLIAQFNEENYPKSILHGTAFIDKDAAGQFGVVDKKGNTLIPFLYNRIQENDLGLLVFKINKTNGYERSYSMGFYNKRLQLILPVAYHSLLTIEQGRLIAARNEDQLFGVVDTSGKQIIPFVYQELYAPQEQLFLSKKGNKYGFINHKNAVVIPHQYTYAGSFSEGKATASTGNLIGYINKHGNFVIPMRFTAADEFKNDYAQVFFNDEASVIDSQGIVLFPFVFSHIACVGNQQFIFESTQMNRIDFEEKLQSISIPENLEEQAKNPIDASEEPEIEAYNDANYFHGILTRNGKLIGGSNFSQVIFVGQFADKNYYAVQRITENEEPSNYNFALMDSQGNLLTPFRFIEVILDETTDRALFIEETEQDSRRFQLDSSGKLIEINR